MIAINQDPECRPPIVLIDKFVSWIRFPTKKQAFSEKTFSRSLFLSIKRHKFSLPVIDLYSVSGMQPNVEEQNKLYFFDGLHPNDLGHKRLAKIIEKYLIQI